MGKPRFHYTALTFTWERVAVSNWYRVVGEDGAEVSSSPGDYFILRQDEPLEGLQLQQRAEATGYANRDGAFNEFTLNGWVDLAGPVTRARLQALRDEGVWFNGMTYTVED